MSDRKVYHVIPDGNSGSWKIKVEGGQRASSVHKTKAEAEQAARNLAKNQPLGQLVVHGSDGKIQKEYTYGRDPYPPVG
ncbi:MAG: DUF2188 domain-containing protein [Anaerolineales bacterium]|nr:DUF2188 domain-containing protein [Anaerolineales bacterium]